MTALRVAAVVLVALLVMVTDEASSIEVGETQCADATAKTILATLGGRSRIMTVLMNFIKCLQKAAVDIFKLVTEVVSDLASCVTKTDPVEIIKCIAQDANVKKISSIVVRAMEVVKCALE